MVQITPKQVYVNRRRFIQSYLAAGLIGSAFPSLTSAMEKSIELTAKHHALSYNNYYEFSTNKESVKHLARALTTEPWTLEVNISGQSEQFSIQDLSTQFAQHARIYKLRCVEGWSMVAPWKGVMLRDLLNAFTNVPSGGFLKFEGLLRPKEMVGQRSTQFPWPYTEGLRMDEAMNDLCLLATGMYNDNLPAQCGAPLRLLVPWKYGFKSIKALTKITWTETEPAGSWQTISPGEYGFYANVNPDVPHPRWSQRRELPLGKIKKIRTQAFNGYAEQVSHLYKGMDLSEHY